MFKQQEVILNARSTIQSILAKYQWKTSPANWLDVAEQESRHFIVTLPFVGAFSAGKSSLINALIGESLFSTNIDPETCYPAELSYGEAEKLAGILPDGREIQLGRGDLRDRLPVLLPRGAYVSASMPHPLLASLPHLRLVDMPGWDSGIQVHADAIDNYATRSLAYCVVVSAEEGNLRESLRRALRELAVRDMPILAVISKADKKTPEDVDAVVEQVRSEIAATMGRPPLAVVKASARKRQFDEFLAALAKLEQQTEQLFASNVTHAVVAKLASFIAHLDTLINRDDLDSENLQAQCEQLTSEIADFEVRLEDETRQLEARVLPVLGHIVDRADSALRDDLESLTDEVLQGGDLVGSIGSLVRLAAQEGIASDFNPEIERYLNRVVDGLPGDFSPEIACSFDYRASSDDDRPALLATPILSMLLPLLKLDPKFKVISTVVLGIIGALESLFSNERQKQADEARQRESVRRKIAGTVIPDTLRQVMSALQPILESHIQSAKAKIADTVHAQQASHGAALRELQAKLAEGRNAFIAARAGYQADRDTISQLITELDQK